MKGVVKNNIHLVSVHFLTYKSAFKVTPSLIETKKNIANKKVSGLVAAHW
jgi:hypothetical protein